MSTQVRISYRAFWRLSGRLSSVFLTILVRHAIETLKVGSQTTCRWYVSVIKVNVALLEEPVILLRLLNHTEKYG